MKLPYSTKKLFTKLFVNLDTENPYRLIVLTLMMLLFLLLSGCDESPSERAAEVGGVTAKEIIENPGEYAGKTVTVSGNIEKIYTERAFSMDSGWSPGELLVLGREPFPKIREANDRDYIVNDVATVTGEIKIFVNVEVERNIGWSLSSEITTKFDAQPVLIAEVIEFHPQTESPVASRNDSNRIDKRESAAQTNIDESVNQSASNDVITDIDAYALTSDIDKQTLAGKQAEFLNATVVRIVGPHTFTVASGEGELYVMLDASVEVGVGSQGNIDPEDILIIRGQFEKLGKNEIVDIANHRFRTLNQQERDFLKEKDIYLHAYEIEGLK